MNEIEKFKKIAKFELGGVLFLASNWQWFWDETIERWKKEGLPPEIPSRPRSYLHEYFNFSRVEVLPIKMGLIPPFEKEVLEEGENYQIIINYDGSKRKVLKENRTSSMDQWLEYPVRDRKSWEEYKKRLNPHTPYRFPPWWEEEKKRYQNRSHPLGIEDVGSFFGWIRNWMGLENLSYMLRDDPSLIEEMEEYIEYFILEILKKVLKDIKPDFVQFWEDMAFKSGPLVSPDFVRKYMIPHYKKITDFLRSNGVEIITLDSDGNIWELIPLWLEGGINGVFPNEVAAGMDIVEMRKKFGKNLIIIGGIDKRALAKGRKAIEEEVMKKVPYLLSQGGYFPAIDHSIPPDVPFENYLYYLELLRKIGG